MKKFFSSIYPVQEHILDEYIDHWSEYEVTRKTIMTAPGDTERFIYFVIEGIQKSYYQIGDKQHIIAFAYPPSFSGIPESFFTQSPSKYFLETLTDSKFMRLPFTIHEQLMKEHREIETLFRKATEFFLAGVIERHHELMAFDIESRFKNFVRRSPHLLNMIPQKDLASYLRIDPTNFSKMMNSIKI